MSSLAAGLKRGTEEPIPGLTDVGQLDLDKRTEIIEEDLKVAYEWINEYVNIRGFTGKEAKQEFLSEFASEARYLDKANEIIELRETLPDTYFHCLRTALETKMFVDNGLSNKDFYIDEGQKSALLTAAMIHDYMKKYCNHEIVNRNGSVTKEELAELKTHVHAQKAIESHILKDDGLAPEQVEMIVDLVQGHHPRYGVPLQNGFGQLLALADCYDAGKIRQGYQHSHQDSSIFSFFQSLTDDGLLDKKYAKPFTRMIMMYSREGREKMKERE